MQYIPSHYFILFLLNTNLNYIQEHNMLKTPITNERLN